LASTAGVSKPGSVVSVTSWTGDSADSRACNSHPSPAAPPLV
jgi:hypothetical protein